MTKLKKKAKPNKFWLDLDRNGFYKVSNRNAKGMISSTKENSMILIDGNRLLFGAMPDRIGSEDVITFGPEIIDMYNGTGRFRREIIPMIKPDYIESFSKEVLKDPDSLDELIEENLEEAFYESTDDATEWFYENETFCRAVQHSVHQFGKDFVILDLMDSYGSYLPTHCGKFIDFVMEQDYSDLEDAC